MLNASHGIGTIPTELGLITGLNSLHLFSNRLTGTSFRAIMFLSTFTYSRFQIEFSANNFLIMLNASHDIGTLPTELGLITGLDTLYLFSNRLTGTTFRAIMFASISSLYVSYNGNTFLQVSCQLHCSCSLYCVT